MQYYELSSLEKITFSKFFSGQGRVHYSVEAFLSFVKMFFSLFFSFVLSGLYVPVVPEESFLLVRLNTTQAVEVIQNTPKVILFVHDHTNKASVRAKRSLTDAIYLFKEYLVFIEMSAKDAEPLIEKLDISTPHILYYSNGSLTTHCNFPASETALLYMFDLFASGERAPINTETQFLKSLGTSYYTLLFPRGEINHSSHAHQYASSLAGFIDLFPFTPSFAHTFGLNESQMYLFRLEDVSLVPVNDNITEILEATLPDFKRISPNDFSSDLGLILGVVVNKVTTDTVEFLETFSEGRNKNMTIGFIDRPLHSVTNATNGGTIKQIPSIVLFSTAERYYYPIPDEINKDLYEGKPIDAATKLKEYLKDLPAPISPSEEPPTEQTGNIFTLVGKTHDAFAADPSKDSIIMYVSPMNLQTQKFKRIFQEVANEYLATENADKIQFGYINVTRNAADYPYIPVFPHFELYPARNKSDHRTFYGQATRDEYVRFINKYSSCDYGIEAPEPTQNDISLEVVQIYAFLRTMDDDSFTKANERLHEIIPKLGMTVEDFNTAVFGVPTLLSEENETAINETQTAQTENQ